MEIYATFKGLNRNLRVHFYMSSSKSSRFFKTTLSLTFDVVCAMSGFSIEKQRFRKESGNSKAYY